MVRAITVGAITVGCALAGAMSVAATLAMLGGQDASPGLPPSTAALISTPMLAAHVAWRSLRSDRPVASVVMRALGAGVLNVPLAAALVATSYPDDLARMGAEAFVLVPFGLLVATVFASPLGGGLGLAFGIALAPLVSRVRDDLAYLDLGAPARAAVASGVWLLAIAALSAVASAWDVGGAMTSAMICAPLGGALTLAGTLARVHRARWVGRIARGEVPGWAIVSRAEAEVGDEIPLFDRGVIGDQVLVRVHESGDGAYRTARGHLAYASLPER